MFRSFAPVPWVPVEIAPEIVCRSMSPRFSIARPSRASSSLRSARTVPPPTLTRPDPRSASNTPASAPTSTIVPSVRAASVNEWPEPATLIGAPSAAAAPTSAASSSRFRGRTIFRGRQAWSPAQLRHSAIDPA